MFGLNGSIFSALYGSHLKCPYSADMTLIAAQEPCLFLGVLTAPGLASLILVHITFYAQGVCDNKPTSKVLKPGVRLQLVVSAMSLFLPTFHWKLSHPPDMS